MDKYDLMFLRTAGKWIILSLAFLGLYLFSHFIGGPFRPEFGPMTWIQNGFIIYLLWRNECVRYDLHHREDE